MNYLATSINTSPTISEKAGAAIQDVRGYAVKFDASGNVVLASAATDPIIGIGIMTNGNQGAVAQGDDVDVQIWGIGAVAAGGEIAKGASLSVNTLGQFVTTSGSDPVVAIALEAAAGAGQYIAAILKIKA